MKRSTCKVLIVIFLLIAILFSYILQLIVLSIIFGGVLIIFIALAKWGTWLNKNSSAIQAVVVPILVIITGIYAISTHQMVTVMSNEFEPYLSAEDLEINYLKNGGIEVNAIIRNVGAVPVRYSLVEKYNSIINSSELSVIDRAFDLFPEQEFRESLFTLSKESSLEKYDFGFSIHYYGYTTNNKPTQTRCIRYSYRHLEGSKEKYEKLNAIFC